MVDKQHILDTFNTWFKTAGLISIDDEGLISVKGRVTLRRRPIHGALPVKFDTVEGDFFVDGSDLTSFENSPRKITGHAWFQNNPISSWQHAPKEVHGYLGIANSHLFDLDGLPKGMYGLGLNYSAHMPLLKAIEAKTIDFPVAAQAAPRALQTILNRFGGEGLAGSFACAHELELAGFKDNARW